MKSIFCLLAVCLSTVLCADFSLEKTKTLIVGTNAEFPPFTYIEKGQVVGLDIDIAKEVCKRLGKEMLIRDMPYDALIPDLLLGRVHFVAAGMTPTEERAKKVSFATPHLNNDPLIVLAQKKEGADTKDIVLEDLKGKRVVVNEGYTADLFLSSKPGLSIMRIVSPADAFVAVKSGQADFFVTAKSTLSAFIAKQPTESFRYNVISNQPESYALTVSKLYPELFQKIQQTLQEMEKDGTLTKLRKKWNFE